MLEHGGQLRAAAQRWGIPRTDWLDLSTGIAPWPYPVPALPAETWQRLPEADDGLEAAAADYYGVNDRPERLLILPGSQAAIQWLPRLFPGGRVAMPMPLYNEHPAAWQAAGHALVDWNAVADYAVLCNPNNPSGERYTPAALLERARALRLLVVDEAFIDATPADSLAALAGTADARNIVVLRSLGKFFGLAGARVGCAIAAPELLGRLRAALGPWAVNHPSRWVARLALADSAWQAAQLERLRTAAGRLDALLQRAGFAATSGTALFRYLPTPRAAELYEALARRGILVRHFSTPPAMRCGLPGSEDEWRHLTDCLKEIS